MIGAATLFQRGAPIEAGWRVVQRGLDAWAREPSRGLSFYAASDEGPREADELIQGDGRRWRPLPDGPKLLREGQAMAARGEPSDTIWLVIAAVDGTPVTGQKGLPRRR